MPTWRGRAKQILLGDTPRALVWLMAPTALSIGIDLLLRGRDFLVFEPHGKVIYFSSLLVSSAFWVLPLLVAARLVNAVEGPRKTLARVGLVLVFLGWVFPIAAFGYGGQILYFRVFGAYAGRDTLRLGALFRAGYWPWFFAWSSGVGLFVMLVIGACVTFGAYRIVRRVAKDLTGRFPILPIVTFLGAVVCFWTDNVDSRFLQAATPDTCFVNGATHALRAATTGEGRIRQGVTLRDPAPLPKLQSKRARPPNVILVITESVRADTLCSDPPPRCKSRFLDAVDVAADRIPLGKLTAQTPNTFSATITLWTGVAPNTDFAEAHRAPVLWEVAHALGYRTAYITSQNAKYEDFGVYVHNAGIDVRETSTELGGMAHEQLGAPDERATAEMLRFIQGTQDAPYFAVLQLSNTHHPYRVDPDLEPNTPSSDDPSKGIGPYFNRYRNSVLMQERLVASFLRDVRATPSWHGTAIVLVSDHAEQFGEHGGTHHNHSVYDSDLRIPGFMVAGDDALDNPQRAALRSLSSTRTYSQDINATIVDLLGAGDERASLPGSSFVHGRSLLRPRAAADEVALLATSTGVWEPNDAWFGVMQGERALLAYEKGVWACFDVAHDPDEKRPLAGSVCPDLLAVARREFPPGVGRYPK